MYGIYDGHHTYEEGEKKGISLVYLFVIFVGAEILYVEYVIVYFGSLNFFC